MSAHAAAATARPGDLMARLRTETAASHRALEAAMDIGRRLERREAYAGLLLRLHGFHAAWEPAAAALIAEPGFFDPRRRAHLLDRDLAALGADPAGAPRAAFATAMEGRAEALGWLYVLEGSTLGGRWIAAQAQGRLGLKAETGLSYHTAFGRGPETSWRAFREALPLRVNGVQEQDRVVRGADALFTHLGRWLAA